MAAPEQGLPVHVRGAPGGGEEEVRPVVVGRADVERPDDPHVAVDDPLPRDHDVAEHVDLAALDQAAAQLSSATNNAYHQSLCPEIMSMCSPSTSV